jgi:TetR/AcrR family transcriptional regulator, transcriptional repressor for nem operon
MEYQMRYPAADTAARHQKLLHAASRMFRERGVEDVSVSEVMKAAGLTHGAFYAHFDSKDALASAAMGMALENAAPDLSAADRDPDAAKRDYLDFYLGTGHRDDPGTGCPITALAGEIVRRDQDRPAFSRAVGRMVDGLARAFRWRNEQDARDQAILMTAAKVGAVILARTVDDPDLSAEILAATKRQLLAGAATEAAAANGSANR